MTLAARQFVREAVGAVGELLVSGPGVLRGYYGSSAASDAAFTDDGWMHTGDKGAFDAAGNLKITGRVKDLFKTSKGKYVAPAPIEDKLVMHNAIEACCVTGANLGQPLGIVMLNAEALVRYLGLHANAGPAEVREKLKLTKR